MPSLSRCEVIGNVAGDPEIRATASGDAVANFSVAYNEKWRAKDGTDKERVEFFRCVAFGQTVEKFVGPYVKSGDLVRVVGKLWSRRWTDKQGAERVSTELTIDRFEGIMILKSKDGAQRGQQGQGQGQGQGQARGGPAQTRGPAQGQSQGGAGEDFSDSIPF